MFFLEKNFYNPKEEKMIIRNLFYFFWFLLVNTVFLFGFLSCKEKKQEVTLELFSDKPDHYFVYTLTVLNVRDKPSREGVPFGKLERGTEVKLLEKTNVKETIEGIPGEWWKIEVYGKEGYVFSGYLSRYKLTKEECNSFRHYLWEMFGPFDNTNTKLTNFQSSQNDSCDIPEEIMACKDSISFTIPQVGIEYSQESGFEWMNEEVFFPNMEPQEGFLLLRDCCRGEKSTITYTQFMDMLQKGKPIPEFTDPIYTLCSVKKKGNGLVLGTSSAL